MCVLGIQKLQDIERFSTMFLNYDLLAQRDPRYGYIYPFVETLAGVLMLAGALIWLAAPAALFVGTIGAISVFKAVYPLQTQSGQRVQNAMHGFISHLFCITFSIMPPKCRFVHSICTRNAAAKDW